MRHHHSPLPALRADARGGSALCEALPLHCDVPTDTTTTSVR